MLLQFWFFGLSKLSHCYSFLSHFFRSSLRFLNTNRKFSSKPQKRISKLSQLLQFC
nr:MAG TPA: hypothetical protein [Caudoviricetes sp.]